ncbi:hypothetical protein C8J57DRAFT_1241395 [Mycena rebaudengoi]|nr:hypothetical protein C8J57DRAFT_1241395 [Mycena rebaudengoi]
MTSSHECLFGVGALAGTTLFGIIVERCKEASQLALSQRKCKENRRVDQLQELQYRRVVLRGLVFIRELGNCDERTACIGLTENVILQGTEFPDAKELYGDASATCKLHYVLSTRHGQAEIRHFFGPFDLDAQYIRPMLTSTESIVGGISSYYSLFPGCSDQVRFESRGPTKAAEGPMKLEIYVGYAVFKVVTKFLSTASQYEQGNTVQEPCPGISRTVEFVHKLSIQSSRPITVYVCAGANPVASAFRQKNTALFTFISGAGIFTGYSTLTFNHIALPNHLYLPLDVKEHLPDVKKHIKDMEAHGLLFKTYHLGSNTSSGNEISCPAQIRTTQDSREMGELVPGSHRLQGNIGTPAPFVHVAAVEDRTNSKDALVHRSHRAADSHYIPGIVVIAAACTAHCLWVIKEPGQPLHRGTPGQCALPAAAITSQIMVIRRQPSGGTAAIDKKKPTHTLLAPHSSPQK